jgi:hypothetical protein
MGLEHRFEQFLPFDDDEYRVEIKRLNEDQLRTEHKKCSGGLSYQEALNSVEQLLVDTRCYYQVYHHRRAV